MELTPQEPGVIADFHDLDEVYVRNWSPCLDVVILLKTITVLTKREGAF